MTESYTINNAKNDIQNLQSQNLYDFQEIKRLEEELNKVNGELHFLLKIYKSKHLIELLNELETEINTLQNKLIAIDSRLIAIEDIVKGMTEVQK